MKALCISIAFLTLLVGIVGCSKPSITSPESPENEAVSTETPETPTTTPVSTLSLASVVAEVSPAVVRVVTNKGMGSGMIVDKAGYVLTNSHVIEGSQSIRVVFADKREYPASVVGRDEMKDLAILKIVATGLPVATLGNSEKLTPGDEVIAIGYPLDLAGTATISRGVVSAFRNDNEIGLTYIQTDASINPGSSGGALINLAGEVVGINVMTIRVAGGLPIEGMNFAIAINSAKPIIPKLIAGITVLKPWVTYSNPTYGYSIEYPNDMHVQEVDTYKVMIFSNSFPVVGNVDVRVSEAVGYSSPQDYVTKLLVSKSNILNSFLLLSSNEVMHGAQRAWELTYTYTGTADGKVFWAKELIILSSSHAISVGYMLMVPSTSREDYSPIFDKIIASFRLIE